MVLQKIIAITIIVGISASSIFAGSLSGRVNFQGNAPKKKTLKMDADPVCGAAHKTPPYRQSFIMNDEGYLKNVMVYLQNVKYDGKIPETQAVLDQNGCVYSPHVQGMMKGQDLLIKTYSDEQKTRGIENPKKVRSKPWRRTKHPRHI